ncbi:MAG: hypothetical protein WCO04_05915 [Pseudomonadota bacterium]
MTFDRLRLTAARLLVLALWLHMPLVAGLLYQRGDDPIVPMAVALALALLASGAVMRRSLAPLGPLIIALAYGGIVVLGVGLSQDTPWQTVGPIYTVIALALMLPLCSAPAVLGLGTVVLTAELARQVLGAPMLADWPQTLARCAFFAGETAVLAALAQAMARVLHNAQSAALAAKDRAEGLWADRTNAQIAQAQFVAALVERITALAQDPLNPAPPATPFPFAYAQVDCAVDLLAQKLRRGCGWGDLSWLAGPAPKDLAAALMQLTACLQDQSARVQALSQAAQLDYRAKILHTMRLDLADLTDQVHQTAAFAAALSQSALGYSKTPIMVHRPASAQTAEPWLAPATEPVLQSRLGHKVSLLSAYRANDHAA